MMTYAELETFYLDLVSRAREAGVTCAITSGMACVHYGVAQTTKDCDLLCEPEDAGVFLDLIAATRLKDASPAYRGNLSPPMDQRWLVGGWTSHFIWPTDPKSGDGAYLDVFGVPPRASSPWQNEIDGFYSGRHTVAEMKRTDREKDWPFATALGERMIEGGDERGWLHIFESKRLVKLAAKVPIAESFLSQRPALTLLNEDADPDSLELAIRAEKEFWHQLDSVRISAMRANVRKYVLAVRKANRAQKFSFDGQHKLRLEIAGELLPFDPIEGFSPQDAAAQAREKALKFLPETAEKWLPEIDAYLSLFARK